LSNNIVSIIIDKDILFVFFIQVYNESYQHFLVIVQPIIKSAQNKYYF